MEFYRLSGFTFYDCLNVVVFFKPFLDNKVNFLRHMKPLSDQAYVNLKYN